jgi:ParB family chromosome partitioning protein
MVSRMLKVGTAFDLEFLRQVGRAPSVGRERWMQLVSLFEEQAARSRAGIFMRRPEFTSMDTDARFEAVLKAAQNKHREQPPAPPQARKAAISSPDGAPIATVKATDKGVSLTVKTEGFDRWIEENASELMNEWFARWQSGQSE